MRHIQPYGAWSPYLSNFAAQLAAHEAEIDRWERMSDAKERRYLAIVAELEAMTPAEWAARLEGEDPPENWDKHIAKLADAMIETESNQPWGEP